MPPAGACPMLGGAKTVETPSFYRHVQWGVPTQRVTRFVPLELRRTDAVISVVMGGMG